MKRKVRACQCLSVFVCVAGVGARVCMCDCMLWVVFVCVCCTVVACVLMLCHAWLMHCFAMLLYVCWFHSMSVWESCAGKSEFAYSHSSVRTAAIATGGRESSVWYRKRLYASICLWKN